MDPGNMPIQARRTPAAIAHQAGASGHHQEFLTIPSVQTDDNPIIFESVEIGPSLEIFGPHSLSDGQAFRDRGCVRCPVDVMDSDGAFQSRIAHINNGAHSFITQVLANTLRLQLIPLPPNLGRRSYFASFGKWQPTQYVSMEVRVPQFGITSTKLSVGVLEEGEPSTGPEVTLGKGFIQKAGACIFSCDATGLGDTGLGDVGTEEANLPGVTPDVGEPISTRLPLLTHCGTGRTPVPNPERPSISGADVGPVDFSRLDPSGWPRTGPSRSTSGIAGTPFTTAVDVMQSSAPTSIALEDPPGKDSKEILDVPTHQGLIDHKNHDGQFFIACLIRPRFVCTAPEDFP